MRKLLLATTAAAVAFVGTPAFAQDSGGYIGVEGGVLFPRDQDIDGAVNFNDPAFPDLVGAEVGQIDYKTGYDIDLIGGYDFGMFRLEGEIAYKRTKADNIEFDAPFLTAINTAAGTTLTNEDFDLNGKTSVLSGMINGLVDFDVGGFGAYAGAGIGRARVRTLGDADNAWAYQLIAGVKTAVSDNLDVGLKYRYFRTGRLNFNDTFAFVPVGTGTTGGTATFDVRDNFQSHSLLLSLVYNFAAAAPPPPPPVEVAPPPPVAPATQTCPDGSVILATSTCPLPPAPPPPPPVERGERGR